MAPSRKNRRNSRKNRRMNGGQAPVNYSNPGPMNLSLGQGQQFAQMHAGQHGGMGPYPGSVTGSMLPGELAASARVAPTLQAYEQIRGLRDQAGGRKGRKASRKNRKASRKNRKASRKNRSSRKNRKASRKNRSSRKNRRQNGGDFVRWGGGYNSDVDAPMTVAESSKMLIPSNLLAQAGLHREWADAANPSSMMPK